MLESADTTLLPEAALAVEEPPDEVFEQRKIGAARLDRHRLARVRRPRRDPGAAAADQVADGGRLPAPAGGTVLARAHPRQRRLRPRRVEPSDLGRPGVAAHLGRVGRVRDLIGGFLGLVAGFKGGITDTILSAFFNIFLAFPQLVLALTLVSVLAPVKPSGGAVSGQWAHRIIVVILAIGIVSVPLLGRITRASAISWSQREFVMAARGPGCHQPARHVPRGVAQRHARDAVDRAARRGDRARARRCAGRLRREHPGARSVVGEHDLLPVEQPQLGARRCGSCRRS